MIRNRLVRLVPVALAAACMSLTAWGAAAQAPGIGPMPVAALALPADSTFVMGLDLSRLVASPMYAKLEKSGSKPGSLGEIEGATGVVPGRDISSMIVAGSKGDDAVVMVFGKFDLVRIAAVLETKGNRTSMGGVPVYSGIGSGAKTSVALVDNGLIVAAPPARLEALISARKGKNEPFRQNKLVATVKTVATGPAFWLVGDGAQAQDLAGRGPASMIPPLDTVIVLGDFAPDLNLRITGRAADEAKAKQTAEMVRGLVAMAGMNSTQNADVKALLSGLSVANEGTTVTLGLRIAYDVLERLIPATPPKAKPTVDLPPPTR